MKKFFEFGFISSLIDNKFLYTNKGILAYANNDNRIIIYGNLINNDIKEIKYEDKSFDNLNIKEKELIIEEYNFKKKNLIINMFFSNDKKLLFVIYTDNYLEVYDNESKKLLNSVEASKYIRYIDTYIGKTDNNEYLIKGNSGGYILNKDFELIAYVPSLYDYNNGNLIIKKELKFYEVNLYNANELIKKAEEKINNN